MTDAFAWLGVMLAAQRKRRDDKRDAAERTAIAKVYNDRYCYRVLFDVHADRLPGSAIYGLLPRGGNRWMCADCNRIHAPTACSAFSGLQYPACCGSVAGHRLHNGVRIS